MAFDVAVFRTNFPDFASETTYPDAMLNYWGSIATILHNVERFAEIYDHVISLYVAHKAILQAKNVALSKNNAVPTQYSGAINSASVGQVSKSYGGNSVPVNQGSPTDEEFSETTYGRQYLTLRNMYCNMGWVF